VWQRTGRLRQCSAPENACLTPKRWSRIREIFDAAIAHSAPEVKAYIRDTWAGDDELLSEIRRMLEEHAQTGTLDRPVWETTPAPQAPLPPVFSPGQIVAGCYRVIRYISCMGEVYEVEHPLLPDRVALKTLLPAGSQPLPPTGL
jgi:hypothetical protein